MRVTLGQLRRIIREVMEAPRADQRPHVDERTLERAALRAATFHGTARAVVDAFFAALGGTYHSGARDPHGAPLDPSFPTDDSSLREKFFSAVEAIRPSDLDSILKQRGGDEALVARALVDEYTKWRAGKG